MRAATAITEPTPTLDVAEQVETVWQVDRTSPTAPELTFAVSVADETSLDGATVQAGARSKATGEVEIVWGGGKGMSPAEPKLAFAAFNAFAEYGDKPARGEFFYQVFNADMSLHREIGATVIDAVVDPVSHKAWFVAVVTSDVRICSGEGSGGMGDDGCGDDGTGDDGCGGDTGGCGGDTGGCGGDTGGTGGDTGGCGGDTGGTGGDTGGPGGDTGGTGGDTGGCGGDTGGTGDTGSCGGDTGGCAGGGDAGHGGSGGVSGKDSRVGQIVAVKVHDKATPGADGDGITWKWFAPEGAPTVADLIAGAHLCKKTILGGNLVVHPVNLL